MVSKYDSPFACMCNKSSTSVTRKAIPLHQLYLGYGLHTKIIAQLYQDMFWHMESLATHA